MWGQKEGGYCLVIRQKNKVKGYELNHWPKGNVWGISLGHFKTKREAMEFALKHKQESDKEKV